MSTPLPSSPDELDDALAALPLGRAAPPRDGHVDDGELITHRTVGLAPLRAAAVDAHLAECSDCRALLTGLAEPAPSLPIPLPRRRTGPSWTLVAPVLAAAAAVALYLAPTAQTPARTPAPEYVVRTVRGALAEVRSGAVEVTSGVVRIDPRTRFVAIVEPKLELTGPEPIVKVFVAREGGVLTPVAAHAVALGVGGVVKLEAPSGELFSSGPGRYEIHVAIANERAALTDLEGKTLAAARTDAPGLGWLKIDVERVDAEVEESER